MPRLSFHSTQEEINDIAREFMVEHPAHKDENGSFDSGGDEDTGSRLTFTP